MKDQSKMARARRQAPTNQEMEAIKTQIVRLADDIAKISANQHKIEEKITAVENRIDRLVIETIELRRMRPI